MVEGGGQFEECVEGNGGFVEYGQQIKKSNDKYKKKYLQISGMDSNHDGRISLQEWLNFMGGKVTDEQSRENIEIGKSALALRNLVMARNLNLIQSHFDFLGHGNLLFGSPS